MISNLDQYNVVHLLFKIFLIQSSGGHFGWQSVVFILWVHCYKIFIFFLISNTFINNADFAIQIFPIKNI